MTPPDYFRQRGDPDGDEPTRPNATNPLMSEEYALGQLRHLFQLMVHGQVRGIAASAHAARNVLGPAIEALQTHHDARKAGGGAT